MKLEVLTKQDLFEFQENLLNAISTMLQEKGTQRKWLKSTDVREMLDISPGTLQNLRVNGTLPFTKIGGTIYYELKDVEAILNRNKQNRY